MNCSKVIVEMMNMKPKRHCKVTVNEGNVVIDLLSEGKYVFNRELGQALLVYRNVSVRGMKDGEIIYGSGSELFADAVCGEKGSNKVKELFRNIYALIDAGITEDDEEYSVLLSQAVNLKNKIMLHEFTKDEINMSAVLYQRVETLLLKGCDEFINTLINNVNFNAWVVVEESTDDFLTYLGSRVFLSEEQNIGQVYLSEDLVNDELDSYMTGYKSMAYLERLSETDKISEIGAGCLKIKDYLDYSRKNRISSIQIFLPGGDEISIFT